MYLFINVAPAGKSELTPAGTCATGTRIFEVKYVPQGLPVPVRETNGTRRQKLHHSDTMMLRIVPLT